MFCLQVQYSHWALLICDVSISHMLLQHCSASCHSGSVFMLLHCHWEFTFDGPVDLASISGVTFQAVGQVFLPMPQVWTVLRDPFVLHTSMQFQWLLCMLPLFPWRILLHMRGFSYLMVSKASLFQLSSLSDCKNYSLPYQVTKYCSLFIETTVSLYKQQICEMQI